MGSFVFRTAASEAQGIGHLVRCSHLARGLQARGHAVRILVDHLDVRWAPFCEGLTCEALYEPGVQLCDAESDVQQLRARLQNDPPDWVVVDDYRLGLEWEQAVAGCGAQIAVLDDLARNHHADLLIDMRWRGEHTNATYRQRIPATAECLLGPRFALLDPQHTWHRQAPIRSERFRVMLGLGGGGDCTLLAQVARTLLNAAGTWPRKLEAVVICGPLATKRDALLALQAEHPELRVLAAPTDLMPELRRTDLYIGAAGGVLYQLLALGIPAFTFALSDNQDNETALLEDLGHYFHAGRWDPALLDGLPGFVRAVMEQPQRIRALLDQARVPVDGQGCSRVVQALERCTVQRLSPQLSLRAVRDTDLNHYRHCRNLAANRSRMIGSGTIQASAHYGWWFSARRESFLLLQNGLPCLYIWHEPRTTAAGDVLIGGWFVCHSEPIGFEAPLLALRWQLARCDQQYPALPWVAVIHRDNAFVKLLNQHCGFEAASAESSAAAAARACFPQATPDQFDAVWRPAQNGEDRW